MGLEQKEQARHTSVPVSEGVDAQEVQVDRRGYQQRGEPGLFAAGPGQVHQGGHGRRGLLSRHGRETDPRAAVGILFDDVPVAGLVLARVPDLPPTQGVQAFDGVLRYGDMGTIAMDPLQGPAVAAHLFLVAIAEGGLAEDQRAHPGGVHFHAFDPVGRHGAVDQGVLAQALDPLGRLAGEEFLPAQRVAQLGQVPGRGGGHGGQA